MSIFDEEKINYRARELKEHSELNGIEFVIVMLENSLIPTKAFLELHFYNNNELSNISAETSENLSNIFQISGGTKNVGGKGPGQVKVIKVQVTNPADNFLILEVSPIGDYSLYELKVSYQNIDRHPFFSKINFKFRPGCFNMDCKPDSVSLPSLDQDPIIDYLAKDYDSFKHTMITSMMQRVPGWDSTSEADLDQVLLDLFSAAADELSDYQDRVMNEAYLVTSKKRVSIARHARLMGYYIGQGNQAKTIVALNVNQKFTLSNIFEVWTNGMNGWTDDAIPIPTILKSPNSVIFSSKDYSKLVFSKPQFYPEFNNIKLYTWNDSIVGLKTGTRSADLAMRTANDTPLPLQTIEEIQKIINDGNITCLLIQAGNQSLIQPTNQSDSSKKARNLKEKRQLVHLKNAPPPNSDKKAIIMTDPLTDERFLRVWWTEGLDFDICAEGLDLFHGNILSVYQGQVTNSVFKDYYPDLKKTNEGDVLYYERTEWGTICKLPEPILYEDTKVGGEFPTASTLRVVVSIGNEEQEWIETPDLIHSTGNDPHYIVETDENGYSNLRFGNGINGKRLPNNTTVQCTYLKGYGGSGNVGADTLVYFNHMDFPEIDKDNCWNPLDVNNGRNMEQPSVIMRRVPEAYKSRQRRAITVQDYVDRVQEIPNVSRAHAVYQWTGSWRTVRISVDPKGGFELDDNLRNEIINHLMAVKLLGEDFEIREARYIPLDIDITFCVKQEYWVEDLRYVVEQEFSTGYTLNGTPGFFNPNLWTFGQNLYSSQILGRLESITGVDHVLEIKMKKRGEPVVVPLGHDHHSQDFIDIKSDEILRVANDPNHPDLGLIHFTLVGGRR